MDKTGVLCDNDIIIVFGKGGSDEENRETVSGVSGLACAFCTGSVYESESFCAAKTTTEKKTTVKTTKKKNGLYKEGNGKFCYYQNNKRIKNTWKTIKGGKYYFDKNGYALIGSFKVGRTLYLFRADGKLYKRNRNGFVKVLGNTYYVLKSGELRTGWSGCYGTRNFRTPYKQLRKVRFD